MVVWFAIENIYKEKNQLNEGKHTRLKVISLILLIITISKDFSGGTMDKNPPANAGDMGLHPGPGRFHMPWSN